jgi:hypothetical protein
MSTVINQQAVAWAFNSGYAYDHAGDANENDLHDMFSSLLDPIQIPALYAA